jgi:hypothetical protein
VSVEAWGLAEWPRVGAMDMCLILALGLATSRR